MAPYNGNVCAKDLPHVLLECVSAMSTSDGGATDASTCCCMAAGGCMVASPGKCCQMDCNCVLVSIDAYLSIAACLA